jgi:hypothetical protein
MCVNFNIINAFYQDKYPFLKHTREGNIMLRVFLMFFWRNAPVSTYWEQLFKRLSIFMRLSPLSIFEL